MKKFNPDSRCDKCGNRSATSAFEPKREVCRGIEVKEAIKRVCVRCGYTWHEAVIEVAA